MDFFGDYGIDEGELDEEESGYPYQTPQRDAVVFLVDCNSSMLEELKDSSDTGVQLCLRCAKNVQQNKIISSDKDVTAIVLYGTKCSSSQDMKNIFVLQTLDQPDASRILQLERLILLSRNDFDDEFGSGQPFALADALWTCLDMFSRSSQKLGFKRIFLFTNEDDPHADKPHLRRQTTMKIDDLKQNNVELDLIHMEPGDGRSFNLDAYYKDHLVTDDDEATMMPDSAQRFEELLARVRAKDHKKRALTRIPFSLGGQMEMQVGVYNLVRSCDVPTAVRLDKRTNEELKRNSLKLLESTAELLMAQDLKKCVEFASRKIYFETDEVAKIRKLAPPGLRLLGFKPRSFLKTHYHIRPSQFLYPDEKTVEGSTTLFTALLQKCLDRNMLAVCVYVPRSNAAPSHVVLLPQAESKDEHGVQTRPSGFHIVFLPYADDLRNIQLPSLSKAESTGISGAKELIKKLKMKFDPENFENPKLQSFYANLEALALDRDEPEAFVDHCEPDTKRISERAGRAIDTFKLAINWSEPSKPRKRGAPASDNSNAGKNAKGGDGDGPVDLMPWAKAGRLAKLTVPMLREGIANAGIKTTATRKADLIKAIEEHYGLSQN